MLRWISVASLLLPVIACGTGSDPVESDPGTVATSTTTTASETTSTSQADAASTTIGTTTTTSGATVTTDSGSDPPDDTTPETTVPTTDAPAVDDRLGPLIDMARADLATRRGIDPSEIEVVSAEAVVWPDAALGCPREGMAYAQVLVDGFKIVLDVDGIHYPYHGGGGTPPFLCEQEV